MSVKLTPGLVAAATGLITLPIAAVAAGSIPELVDQGVEWVAVLVSTAAASAIAGVVIKLTSAALDAKARATLEKGLQRASALALEWVLNEASETPLGQRIEAAVKARMLPYVKGGAPGAIDRFKLDASVEARQHLEDMARAELVDRLGKVAPDKLAGALSAAIRVNVDRDSGWASGGTMLFGGNPAGRK